MGTVPIVPRVFLPMMAVQAITCLLSPAAYAQDPASVGTEILVVLASEADGTIDPELAQMPALRRPPFNAFHTMQVLTRTELPLSPTTPILFTLPNGRILRIELDRQTLDGRYRVRVSINTPGQSDYLPLLSVLSSPGEPFFIAGQTYALGPLSGTLVIGVRIGERASSDAAPSSPPRRKV